MGRVQDKLIRQVNTANCPMVAQQAVNEYLNDKLEASPKKRAANSEIVLDKFVAARPQFRRFTAETTQAYELFASVKPLFKFSKTDLQVIRKMNGSPTEVPQAVEDFIYHRLSTSQSLDANRQALRSILPSLLSRVLHNRRLVLKCFEGTINSGDALGELVRKLGNYERRQAEKNALAMGLALSVAMG
jgi:hypothetical protein